MKPPPPVSSEDLPSWIYQKAQALNPDERWQAANRAWDSLGVPFSARPTREQFLSSPPAKTRR